MNIVFFIHPAFSVSASMPRFAGMLSVGMKERGHTVEIWTPVAQLSRLTKSAFYNKWLGYFDLYILFRREARKRLENSPPNTLFVITDNALGPLVPLVSNRPHVIHCHDFLAQRSALGEIPENPLSWTGKQYQAFIRRGYTQGNNFISVSKKTKYDLHSLLSHPPVYSEVVYTGLNQEFYSQAADEARILFGKTTGLELTVGYLLHVGGNQWYKNRKGVIDIYDALRLNTNYTLPLVMIGPEPAAALMERQAKSPFSTDIHLLTGISDSSVRLAYAGASVFLFPSLAEGFGWPIAEAMAAGCPVVTTSDPPMTEVAGDAGFFVPRRPSNEEEVKEWAIESANVVRSILDFSPGRREEVVQAGHTNARRFNTNSFLNEVESIYIDIVANNQCL